MDRPGRTPEESTDEQPAIVRGVIIPDNIEAQRTQLQEGLNLFRKGLQLLSQAFTILEQVTQGQQDPNSEEQG